MGWESLTGILIQPFDLSFKAARCDGTCCRVRNFSDTCRAAGAHVKEKSQYSRSKETLGTGAKRVTLPGDAARGECLGCGGF